MKKSIEAFKKMNRKNKIILVSILSGIILVFGATTFAFFSSSINGEKQPLSVTTGTLRLDFNDVEGNGIIEGEMGIDKTISKRMMISNTGTQDVTATIMWNELENTYLAQSLLYTIKQTQEYDINEELDINTLEYNQEVPQAGIYVPRSEEPKKTALTRGLLIPAGKKIYYEVTIIYNHLNDVDQNADLEARLYTSFTIEEGEQLDPITITAENRSLLGYTGVENEELEIPATYQDENGTLYKVSSIGTNAFKNCSNLKLITIPDSVTSIGKQAFDGCTGLMSIILPNSVTSIENWAFRKCSNLISITIPANITHIVTNNNRASYFAGCNNLTSINVDENNQIYKSIDGVVFNKDGSELVLCPPGKVGEYIIPNSTINIKSYAFNGCRGLTSITIPGSVTSIKTNAFSNCSVLTSITIPDSVTSIGDSAFSGCTGITSITIPDSVTSIGNNTFKNVPWYQEYVNTYEGNYVTLGNNVLIAYKGTETEIVIPNDITSIGGGAFYNYKGLTSITISDSVISIGNYAFSNCSGLTSITIPGSVISIGIYAFQNCTGLTSITIPNSITSIGSLAFNGCSSLLSIDVDPNNNTYKSINGVLFTKDEKTLVGYPNGKTETSYTIPDTVTSIENYAFYNCTSLTTVTYKGTAYTSKSAFTTAFTSTSGNTIGTNVFYGTKLIN